MRAESSNDDHKVNAKGKREPGHNREQIDKAQTKITIKRDKETTWHEYTSSRRQSEMSVPS